MGLRDIVVSILLQLDPTARSNFITNMVTTLNQASNPTKTKANLKEIEFSLDGLGRAITRVRNLFLITFGGRLIADFIRGSIGAFMEFEQTLNKSIAIMGDVSDAMRYKLGATALELSKELNISAAEINQAYYNLASAGLTAEQSIKAIPIVAAYAKAGLMGMDEASRNLLMSVSAMGYSSKDAVEQMAGMARVADVITRASKTSQGHIDDLTIALNNKAGPAFRMLGKDVEEAMAGLAVLANKGDLGTRAGERLSIFLRSVANASITHKQAWHDAGVEIYDATGKMKPLADVVQELTDYLGKLSPRAQNVAIMHLGMQQRSIDATKAFIGQADEIRRLNALYQDASGYTETLANRNMNSLQERLGVVKQKLQAARIEMGEAFLPVMERLGATLGDDGKHGVIGQIRGFGEWVRNNSEIISNFVSGALTLMVLGFESLFFVLNKAADMFVMFTSGALYGLVFGFELAVTGVSLFGHLVEALSGLLGFDGVSKWFGNFTKAVDSFGGDVNKFRTRIGEVVGLARSDLFSSSGLPGSAGDPRFKSEGDLVDKAFKAAKGHSKSNAGHIGTDNSGDADDKDAKAKAKKLQNLMEQISSLLASMTDSTEDNLDARLHKLRDGFESVFGSKKLPADIERILQLLHDLGVGGDYVKVFAENMKELRDNERDDTVHEDIDSWVALIDTMEAALPTLDKNTKAYAELKIQIAAAKKEKDRLMDKERKQEDDNTASLKSNIKDWLSNIKQWSDAAVEAMAKTWENFFKKQGFNMHTMGGIFKTLMKGIVASLVGGLGQYALNKAKENSLHAAEELVKGFAAAVDPLRQAEAPGHFAAAAKYAAIATAWSAAAGSAQAGVSGLDGGGKGASDVGGNNAKDSKPVTQVHIYIDGVDPKNPRHQQLVGDTVREYMERSGTQVFTHPRRP